MTDTPNADPLEEKERCVDCGNPVFVLDRGDGNRDRSLWCGPTGCNLPSAAPPNADPLRAQMAFLILSDSYIGVTIGERVMRHLDTALAARQDYRCGAFICATGEQCTLESDHEGQHVFPVGDVPEGPWRARVLNDANRAWGPTVWNSASGGEDGTSSVAGWDRLQTETIEQAEGVRDALNGLHAKEKADG